MTAPFVNKDGKWAVVVRQGGLFVHVVTRARWDHYDLDGALTPEVLADLAKAAQAQGVQL